MNSNRKTRRRFLTRSLAAAGGALGLANALPGVAAEATSRKVKVVCVGGHPDDPESGCAGTLARYSEQGHAVTTSSHHEIIANFRGREAGVGAAEAFVHLNRDSQISALPGL